MTHYIHITNNNGRDATVGFSTLKTPTSPHFGLVGEDIYFKKYLVAGENKQHEDLVKAFKTDDYGKSLIESDPEIDIEKVGIQIEHSMLVFLDGNNELMHADPKFLDLILNADGSEKEKKEPIDTESNIHSGLPLRWTGKKVPLQDAIRKYFFKRTIQLCHTDGLSFDFLFNIAKELEDEKCMVLIGSGEKGAGPLILQANGRAYRGFLSGRTLKKTYKLMLHLTDMELKKPAIQG